MKKPILVLLALLALTPFTQLLAQAPPVAVPPANDAAAPAPDVTQFLATLSDGQSQTPSDLVPAPSFMALFDPCTSSSQCAPANAICCNGCGRMPNPCGGSGICRAPGYAAQCPVD